MENNNAKQEFMHSNREVIGYFVALVHRLSPKYMPTLILQSLLKAIRPLLFIFGPKLIIDELLDQKRTAYLVALIMGIALGNFLLAALEQWMRYKADFLTNQFNNAFEMHIAKKTAEIDYQNIEDPDILNLKERALFAVRNHWLIGSMITALSNMTNEAFLLVSLLAIIWTFSPWALLLLVAVVGVNSLLFKRVQHYYYEESVSTVSGNRAFVYYIGQSGDLEIAKDIRLYKMSKMIIDKMDRFNLRIYKLYSKIYASISQLNGLVSVNVQFQTVVVYAMLAFRAIKGSVSIGDFMMYAGAIGKFGSSMNTWVSSFIEVNRLCRQLELLVAYEAIPASKDSGHILVEDLPHYEVVFHNVSFKYPKAKNYTLKNISVTLKPGEKISIIGRNGAGKTTFVKLLTRLYKPTEGMITLNGIDIQSLDYDSYMAQISAVFQDYRLFGITIEENVSCTAVLGGFDEEAASVESGIGVTGTGGTGVTGTVSDRVARVLAEVGMADDVNKLQFGMKTPLDKGYDRSATKLSGGQAQKLAIGRAVYKEAKIVVLDEPTAALDPIAESDVYTRFDELVQGKTAIYISHRLSSCRFCDRILVFDQGQIVEMGSHVELVAQQDSLYYEMFNAQAQYYTENAFTGTCS